MRSTISLLDFAVKIPIPLIIRAPPMKIPNQNGKILALGSLLPPSSGSQHFRFFLFSLSGTQVARHVVPILAGFSVRGLNQLAFRSPLAIVSVSPSSRRLPPCFRRRAYDKVAIKYNGKEAVTNFEPSTYEGEMKSPAINEGGSPNLELNLGIATPGHGLKENRGQLQFPWVPYSMHAGRTMVETNVKWCTKS